MIFIKEGDQIDMNITFKTFQAYLYEQYGQHSNDQSLFMKLVEEIGEVAEVLNKKAGRKDSDDEDLSEQLGNELADVIHYTLAIASLNDLDMSQIIIDKDAKASIKYHHKRNLEQFIMQKCIKP